MSIFIKILFTLNSIIFLIKNQCIKNTQYTYEWKTKLKAIKKIKIILFIAIQLFIKNNLITFVIKDIIAVSNIAQLNFISISHLKKNYNNSIFINLIRAIKVMAKSTYFIKHEKISKDLSSIQIILDEYTLTQT